jgi:tetratricopeptide (TPR) repeat protein
MTLLGYSQRILGQCEQAKIFHQDALEIARQVGDSICEIANLNHLSRTSIAQKDYQAAIAYSQRALILARQKGDRLGEANGLVNLGHSQILEANQQEQMQEEFYEQNIEYMKQALSLTERVDRDYEMPYLRAQTQALACNGLGIAYVILGQSQIAVGYLQKGAESASLICDRYLQGINLAYLAEAHYNCQSLELALYYACLAMYILEQLSAQEWRQAAGLTSVLEGRIGSDSFDEILRKHRSEIILTIGVDGFDYIPQLLKKYQDLN